MDVIPSLLYRVTNDFPLAAANAICAFLEASIAKLTFCDCKNKNKLILTNTSNRVIEINDYYTKSVDVTYTNFDDDC